MSDETWANHPKIFAAAGLEQKQFPYYNAATKSLEFEKMIEAIGRIPKGDFILLQGACHNPTGLDPTPEQWAKIAKAVSSRSLFPLIDFAYQGLAEGLEEDAIGARALCANGREALIASSFSKNFGLYKERVGALTIVGADSASAEKAMSHVKAIIRANYSNPPSHGGAIAVAILNDPELRAEWEAEVTAMRERIRQMRETMVATLKAKGAEGDFSFIARQYGMFSYSGLTKEQVQKLKEKYAIYIVGNGRINVAGLTPANMDYVCGAIADVLK
jgi:aspartate/tyrosine/aromatic aminotransferase